MQRKLVPAVAALGTAAAVAVPAAGQTTPSTPTTPLPKDTTAPEVSVAFSSTQLESRLLNQGVEFGLAADENVKVKADLALGARTFAEGEVVASGESEITGGPGKRLVELELTERGRELIRQDGTEALVLRVQAADAAGNAARIDDRLSRTQRLEQRQAE
jgi:hypothetical protein